MTNTKKHKEYWQKRKIDWREAYLSTWNHPHRDLIVAMLRSIPFFSLWEVGCGPGANLIKIVKELPGKQLGGSDINADAIDLARKTFQGGLFHVESGDNMLMSDKSLDVLLTDMCLIYVSPKDIERYLTEFKRVARTAVVLVEFHSDSWWDCLKSRFSRYNVYNYRKILENLGFYDVMVQHIPQEFWPGTDKNTKFRHIITAKIPAKV